MQAGTIKDQTNKRTLAQIIEDDNMETKATVNIHAENEAYNELDIGPPGSGLTRSSDTWITAKIKTILMSSSDEEGSRIKIITENGVVYLMGRVTQDAAEALADTTAGGSGVRRVVRLFEPVD